MPVLRQSVSRHSTRSVPAHPVKPTLQGKENAVGLYAFKVCFIQRRHLSTHTGRCARPCRFQVVRRACTFPVSRYGLIALTRRRRVPDTTLAVELPAPCLPSSEPACRNSMGLLSQQPGAVWQNMTQSPFGRVRCDMCIYPGVSKRAGNGVKTRGFSEGKQGWRKVVLHRCKSGVARESLSGTAQHEHAGAALPVRVTIHSCDPPPEPVPLRHGTARA